MKVHDVKIVHVLRKDIWAIKGLTCELIILDPFPPNVTDLKLYRTRGPKRGILVDFTYTEFDNNIEEFRNGVDVDCNNLKYLFDELGFRRVGYKNLTKTVSETIISVGRK